MDTEKLAQRLRQELKSVKGSSDWNSPVSAALDGLLSFGLLYSIVVGGYWLYLDRQQMRPMPLSLLGIGVLTLLITLLVGSRVASKPPPDPEQGLSFGHLLLDFLFGNVYVGLVAVFKPSTVTPRELKVASSVLTVCHFHPGTERDQVIRTAAAMQKTFTMDEVRRMVRYLERAGFLEEVSKGELAVSRRHYDLLVQTLGDPEG